MLFCGRAEELNELINRWQLASNISDPKPQLVVLKAERGVGKTRLALEFYHWLSENKDPEGYWPEKVNVWSRSFDVNPDPNACQYGQAMPFLWWGIRAADPGAENAISGDAVAGYHRYLDPHLNVLATKSRGLQSGKALLGIWAEVGIGAVANLTGTDTVLSVSEGIFKSAQILRGTLAQKNAPATDEINKKSISRVDAILEDLDTVLNTRSSGFAKTPAIILIDDAQFTPSDPGLADFCEKLMQISMTRKWPLMILVTHWKRDLSPEFIKSEKSFARSYLHARGEITTQTEAVAGLPSPYLNEQNTVEIDLAAVADLSAALKAALPGLFAEQSETLLRQAGGNPRYLEQIITFLTENEEFFEGYDTAKPLTEDGLRQALEATHDIFTVVMRRLKDAPSEVQEAICLASLQGTRFVSDIVTDLAKVILSGDRSDALRQAIDPFSMVTARQAATISEFSERLFYLVAEKRRQSLKQFKDKDALNVALREILSDRINSMEINAVEDVDGALITLELAEKAFVESDPCLVLNALGKICLLQKKRDSYALAVEAAKRYVARFKSNAGLVGDIDLNAQMAVIDVLISAGENTDAWVILQVSLLQMRGTLDQSRTYENQRVLAKLLDKVGDVARAAGNTAAAAVAWEESLEIRKTILLNNQSHENKRELSISLNKIGQSAMDSGDMNMALRLYEDALLIARDIDIGLQTQQSKRDVWFSLTRVGRAAKAIGDVSMELKICTESLDIARDLEANLKTPQSLSDMQYSLNMVGDAAKTAGDLTFATQVWQEGLSIARELARRMQSQDNIYDLWVSLNKVGEGEFDRGNVSVAAQLWQEGLNIARSLVDRTDTLDNQRAVWGSLANIVTSALVAGDLSAALDAAQESVDIARYLKMRFQTPASQNDLLASLDRFADVVMQQGDAEKAAETWGEAVEDARQLAGHLKTAPSNEHLAILLTKLAKAKYAMGHSAEAEHNAREAVEISRNLDMGQQTNQSKFNLILAIFSLIMCSRDLNEAKKLIEEGEKYCQLISEPERDAFLVLFGQFRKKIIEM